MVWFCRLYLFLLAVALLGAATADAAQLRGAQTAATAAARHPAPAQPPGGSPGNAAPEMRIAAVVNDQVISVFDLASRIRLLLISSNLPDTPEARQKVAAQVLRSLIDEKLQLQEAKKQNVTATDEEINRALAQIEKQNNMKSGQLNDFLQARGIDRGSLVDQLTAAIVWAKLVKKLASQSIEISDEEVDEALKQAKEHANEPQSRIAEIFLAIDNPSQEDEVKRLAERLSDQMKQGARFSAVAQQFSQSATAAVGGDMGWMRSDQLPPELGKVVTQLKVGELSQPIRTGGGFYLMLVVDRRTGTTGGGTQEAIYDIVQVVFPLPSQATEAMRRTAVGEAQSVRNAGKDCPSLLKIGKEKAPQLSSEGRLRASDLTGEMRNVVNRLPIGQASPPIVQKNGVGVIMVCSKTDPTNGKGPTREEISETIVRQRLDAVARRYLRDLRRTSYVDVRV